MHRACRNGDLDAAKRLHGRGKSIRAHNKFGMTPMLESCEVGALDVA